MVRIVRYPYSPLQEIFLRAEEPFTFFDTSTPSAPSPPSASTSSPDFGDDPSRCLQLKALLGEAERQVRKGNAAEADFATALRQHRRCVNYYQGRLLRSEDEAFLAFRGSLDRRAVLYYAPPGAASASSSAAAAGGSCSADDAAAATERPVVCRHPKGGIDFAAAENGVDRRAASLLHGNAASASLAAKFSLMR